VFSRPRNAAPEGRFEHHLPYQLCFANFFTRFPRMWDVLRFAFSPFPNQQSQPNCNYKLTNGKYTKKKRKQEIKRAFAYTNEKFAKIS
jgi:hypothetical protein